MIEFVYSLTDYVCMYTRISKFEFAAEPQANRNLNKQNGLLKNLQFETELKVKNTNKTIHNNHMQLKIRLYNLRDADVCFASRI